MHVALPHIRAQAQADQRRVHIVGYRQHSFDNEFLNFEVLGHSCANAMSGGQKEQIRHREAIDGGDESGADPKSDRLHIGKVAQHFDEAHDSSDDSDGRRESTRHFQGLGVRFALAFAHAQLVFEDGLQFRAIAHIQGELQRLRQERMRHLGHYRFQRQQAAATGHPRIQDDLFDQCFPVHLLGRDQLHDMAQRMNQRIFGRGDQHDAQRPADYDERARGLEEIGDRNTGRGYTGDDRSERDSQAEHKNHIDTAARADTLLLGICTNFITESRLRCGQYNSPASLFATGVEHPEVHLEVIEPA